MFKTTIHVIVIESLSFAQLNYLFTSICSVALLQLPVATVQLPVAEMQLSVAYLQLSVASCNWQLQICNCQLHYCTGQAGRHTAVQLLEHWPGWLGPAPAPGLRLCESCYFKVIRSESYLAAKAAKAEAKAEAKAKAKAKAKAHA